MHFVFGVNSDFLIHSDFLDSIFSRFLINYHALKTNSINALLSELGIISDVAGLEKNNLQEHAWKPKSCIAMQLTFKFYCLPQQS
jgi:hypothetical protein